MDIDMFTIQGHVKYLREIWNPESGRTESEEVSVPIYGSECVLTARKLVQLPIHSISQFHITKLDLSFNRIAHIPNELVEGTPELKSFFIAHNKVEALPSNIGKWKQLENLYAPFNRIVTLPDMRDLLKLQRLNLRANPLLLVWKRGFGEKWDLDSIEKAADFARTFYQSTGYTESDLVTGTGRSSIE